MTQSSPISPPLSVRTRFAPSPTGHLHLGHAYSAWLNADFAARHGGHFLLRMEDIDGGRCKPEYEQAIYDDLTWLGFHWPTPVRRQSEHLADYQAALDQLDAQGLLYPCFCTRKEIRAEIKNSGYAPHDLARHSSEGPTYPGTCRHLTLQERQQRHQAGTPFALRLDMTRALARKGTDALTWTDLEAGQQIATPEILQHVLGDAVLARKDIPTSYHLSVVVDDHLQRISHVIRGNDLFLATHLHRLLQHLLGYAPPLYRHHDLLTDENGWRYAKRDNAKSLFQMRTEGQAPEDLMTKITL